jgi:hypothetical protein
MKLRRPPLSLSVVLLLAVLAISASADVTLPTLLADHMVVPE